MISDRHQSKQYEEHAKEACHYCHRPAMWQQIGHEKVCSHCGTRVYSPVQLQWKTIDACWVAKLRTGEATLLA